MKLGDGGLEGWDVVTPVGGWIQTSWSDGMQMEWDTRGKSKTDWLGDSASHLFVKQPAYLGNGGNGGNSTYITYNRGRGKGKDLWKDSRSGFFFLLLLLKAQNRQAGKLADRLDGWHGSRAW